MHPNHLRRHIMHSTDTTMCKLYQKGNIVAHILQVYKTNQSVANWSAVAQKENFVITLIFKENFVKWLTDIEIYN